MSRCGICGSDLHIYHGQGFSPDMAFASARGGGEVVEIGRGVSRLKVGDPVMLWRPSAAARVRPASPATSSSAATI